MKMSSAELRDLLQIIHEGIGRNMALEYRCADALRAKESAEKQLAQLRARLLKNVAGVPRHQPSKAKGSR